MDIATHDGHAHLATYQDVYEEDRPPPPPLCTWLFFSLILKSACEFCSCD